MSEAELRAAVVALAKRAGWLVFSLPIAKTRRPVKDAVGYPDLTLARDHDVLWIELKAEKGELSTDQWRWFDNLPRMLIIRPQDLDDLDRVLA